jgi:hypothetical protein
VAYALVIVWAATGIAVKQSGSGLVAGTAIAVAVLVAITTAVWSHRSRRRSPESASVT